MSVPLLLLVGGANTGKDTIASILVKNHGAVSFSLADPIKRFAKYFFLFSDKQLWGPSEVRDIPDSRFSSEEFRDEVRCKYWSMDCWDWVQEVCNHLPKDAQLKAVTSLHKVCRDILEYAKILPLTPRYVLQQVGTTWGRAVEGDLWVTYAIHTAELLATGDWSYDAKVGFDRQEHKMPGIVVISDGRFLNEVKGVKAVNGVVWRINSPQALIRAEHVSETEQQTMPNELFTIIVNNDKSNGLESLERLIKYTYNWTVSGTLLNKEP